MKNFALLFALICSTVAVLDNSAVAATPRASFQITNPGTLKGLNPQPLPPRYLTPSQRFNPGAKVGINPQPLPPRVFKAF